MKASLFQFTNPELVKLYFSVAENFAPESENVNIITNIKTRISRNPDEDDFELATVQLQITIGSPEDPNPYYVEAIEQADFRWKKGMYTDTQIENLLRKNGAALLISYLRPIISTITGFSQYSAFNLPYVDLSQPTDKENSVE